MKISDLKKLTKTTIADIDPLFVQDISESETKLLLSLDLGQYIISSSNLPINLKSGSFTGSFFGNINGISSNASSSIFSKHSLNSNYLNYPNYSSASYSLLSISSSKSNFSTFSLSSSYSITSSNSTTSSYANTCLVNNSLTSSVSNLSLVSQYATSSNYLIYNGTDNGKVYKSIISEYSPTASIGVKLVGNKIKNGILVNESTSSLALSSSFSINSESARYIESVSNSEYSSFALNTDLIPFAYVNFSISHNNGSDWNFVVNQYKNIAEPGIGLGKINDRVAIFTGSYYIPPATPVNPNLTPSATILAETSFNFPFDPFVNYWFTTFSFPINSNKFAICVRIGVVADEDTSNILLPLLNGASISAVMFSNVTGQQTPELITTSSVLNAALLEGCARL